ncbi:WD40 repeat domain-containing protein [Streptomyces sp. NPDC051913]|uniref:WD40 repeat domain-containing protein n=1 Tax=Streptomyces sp. NPDC051913 TaxID=3365676 RepID=UPI0037CF3B65
MFSPTGTVLAAHTPGGGLRLWDVREHKFSTTVGNNVAALGFSPNGKVMAVWVPEDKVQLWNLTSHRTVSTLAGTGQAATSKIGYDDKSLAMLKKDGSIAFWDVSPCS